MYLHAILAVLWSHQLLWIKQVDGSRDVGGAGNVDSGGVAYGVLLSRERRDGTGGGGDGSNCTTSSNTTNNMGCSLSGKSGAASESYFPDDVFTKEQRLNGAIVLHFIGLLYMFLALAITCDDYFVPALEVITEKLQISDDVAGATFMAAGGSAPELFTSLIGTFIAKSNVGIGTIVGSAVFNILFVLGCCGFMAGAVLQLTWWPLARDCIFYVISLGALIGFFWDNVITWWESLILFLIYVAYVTFMMYNEKLEKMCVKQKPEGENEERQTKAHAAKKWQRASAASIQTSTSNGQVVRADTESSTISGVNAKTMDLVKKSLSRFYALRIHAVKEIEKEEKESDILEGSSLKIEPMPEKMIEKILYVVAFPLKMCLKFTIPDVRYGGVREMLGGRIYLVSFIMSIVWIAVFSTLMVWWTETIGDTFSIDSTIMGMTILAAGTSVPDLITSVIVAKKGLGDMAVSSSIGSNIFDVTVGLPIPWLLFSMTQSFGTISVSSTGLVCLVVMLALMLVALVGIISLFKWSMNRPMSVGMILLYGGFVTIAILIDNGTIKCPIESG